MAARPKSERSYQERLGMFQSYTPPGPIAQAWLYDTTEMSFIMGPVGSAKTTTGGQKVLEIGRAQHPSTRDGWRKAYICAIRMNYRQMHQSLIPSWNKMFPRDFPNSEWTGEKDGPCRHVLRFEPKGEPPIMIIVDFRSLADHSLENFVRGFEPTAWWLNEVDELPPGALGACYDRAGRAFLDERPDDLPPVQYSKVFGDLNAPDLDNWFTEDYINAKPAGFRLYRQPSGFDPRHENAVNLRKINPNYYQDKAEKYRNENGDWAVKRFIENEPGISRRGKSIYDTYVDEVHTGKAALPWSGGRIVIGVDQGSTPAAVVCEETRLGGAQVHFELVTPPGETQVAADLGRRVARKMLAEFGRTSVTANIELAFDPASFNTESTEYHFAFNFMTGFREVMGEGVGRVVPKQALSNDPDTRWDAVKRLLREVGGLLVSPDCPYLRRGFMGSYKRAQLPGQTARFSDRADKNEYSHVHDALQYAAQRFRPAIGRMTEVAPGVYRDTLPEQRGRPALYAPTPSILLDHE